ncbi:homoserine kinase [Cucumis melo var. makuwa]|uniref:Homoserine kinase n=1 Tax=Cucumis melo var. makuwa TaxID=1194695 RepID=A0A5D3DRC8_CUCMM|nr:homoserine kinase [Cucumis melo var. makuwa]TYK26102.1 homoserine kinase [Cucumis melo var. makuwa]
MIVRGVEVFAPVTVTNLGPALISLATTWEIMSLLVLIPMFIQVMKMLGIRSVGLSLSLEKGLLLGSGWDLVLQLLRRLLLMDCSADNVTPLEDGN